MDCKECEENTGEISKVEYTAGETETIPLCDECRDEFDKAELVKNVAPVETKAE